MQPEVAAFGPRHLSPCAPDHQHLIDAAGPLQRLVGIGLKRDLRPPRKPSSAVMTSFDLQSSTRPASESGENPPNTTEWIAPMRAQASIA